MQTLEKTPEYVKCVKDLFYGIYMFQEMFSHRDIFADRLSVKVATRLTGSRRKTSAVEDLQKTGHSSSLDSQALAEIRFRYSVLRKNRKKHIFKKYLYKSD